MNYTLTNQNNLQHSTRVDEVYFLGTPIKLTTTIEKVM